MALWHATCCLAAMVAQSLRELRIIQSSLQPVFFVVFFLGQYSCHFSYQVHCRDLVTP